MLLLLSPLLLLSLGVPPALAGRGDLRKMELISPLGRVRSLKIYSGETVTLRVQERRAGIGGIFSPGEYLRGVTFTLRSWPRVTQDAHAITKGAHLPVICTQRPVDELWGAPPSSFTIEVDKPGRYLLTATKPGFPSGTEVLPELHARIEGVDEEVRRLVNILGRNGGFLLGPCHSIQPDVPPQNIRALFGANRTLQRRPGA